MFGKQADLEKVQSGFSLRKTFSKSVDSLSRLMGLTGKPKRMQTEEEQKTFDSKVKDKMRALRGIVSPATDVPVGNLI